MSFPRLVLSGSIEEAAITDIQVIYENDTGTAKPARLTRSRYDVKRQMQVLNVSTGTAKRYPDMPYNAVRFIHTWIGYIDVQTASVAVWGGSTDSVKLNLDLIQQAAILKTTDGIHFTLPAQNAVGPDNPSLALTYEDANQKGLNWIYNFTSDGGNPPTYTPQNTDYWMIKDINVADNQNGTSRVTFHFEFIGIWQSIAAIIDYEA